jgi:flagellar hook-associated protein 2
MGMALSGLASGFDWKSIVDQLIEVSRTPQNRARTEKSTNASKSSALNEIKGLLASLKTSASSLGSADAVLKKSAAFADSATKWTSSATKDTPAGEYNFKITQTATASKLEGSVGVGAFTSSSILSSLPLGRAITVGTFTVNGAPITIASTASDLSDVLSDIEAQLGGGSASIIADKLVLTSSSPITIGAAGDTSNFLLAMGLSNPSTQPAYEISSSQNLSSLNLSVPLASANFSTTNLTPNSSLPTPIDDIFKVNGVSISYNSSSTVQSVLNSINSSAAGVMASYDSANKKFLLTNKNTGDLAISVAGDTGNLSQAMGLNSGATTFGRNAEFTVNNGGTITSRSNVFDESAHGIKGLSVTANATTTPETQKVTVSGDSSDIKSSINDFIAKYNALQSAIEKYTKVTVSDKKVTTAILSGNSELSNISRNLRRILYESGAGVTGTVLRFSDLGVSSSGIESTISFNSASLEARLSSSSGDVSTYFNKADSGLVARLNKLLGSYVTDSGSATGGLQAQLDGITKQNTSLDKQIADVETRLAAQRSTLESGFIAMEKAQSNFQQQSSYLSKTFNNSK